MPWQYQQEKTNQCHGKTALVLSKEYQVFDRIGEVKKERQCQSTRMSFFPVLRKRNQKRIPVERDLHQQQHLLPFQPTTVEMIHGGNLGMNIDGHKATGQAVAVLLQALHGGKRILGIVDKPCEKRFSMQI